MNDILRFVLIIAGLLAVYYFINGGLGGSIIANAGEVTMDYAP